MFFLVGCVRPYCVLFGGWGLATAIGRVRWKSAKAPAPLPLPHLTFFFSFSSFPLFRLRSLCEWLHILPSFLFSFFLFPQNHPLPMRILKSSKLRYNSYENASHFLSILLFPTSYFY